MTPSMPSDSILQRALMSSTLVRPPLAIRNAQLPRELERRVDVHSRQHAVAADVGVDDRLDAIVLEFLREVHHVVTGHLGPALDGDFAVLGVERYDDVP